MNHCSVNENEKRDKKCWCSKSLILPQLLNLPSMALSSPTHGSNPDQIAITITNPISYTTETIDSTQLLFISWVLLPLNLKGSIFQFWSSVWVWISLIIFSTIDLLDGSIIDPIHLSSWLLGWLCEWLGVVF